LFGAAGVGAASFAGALAFFAGGDATGAASCGVAPGAADGGFTLFAGGAAVGDFTPFAGTAAGAAGAGSFSVIAFRMGNSI